MKPAGGLKKNWYLKLSIGGASAWITAGTFAIAYYLAARLGLALLSKPTDVAIFWPASGIAAGILLISGRPARPALVLGVVIGTVGANLMSDRSIWTATFKGFCNAAEAVFVVWLLSGGLIGHSRLVICVGSWAL